MWELYAMWGWIAVYLGDTFAHHGGPQPARAAVWAFLVIAAGFLGSWWAGVWSDRVGRTTSATVAMVISGACALAIGPASSGPMWLVLVIAVVWGASVVADSGQFSTMVTELAEPAYVGTALTLQLALGFTLTVATLWLVPLFRDHWGWTAAFVLLAPGPVVGIAAMLRLQALPEAKRLAGGRG
jgi:MFS family permease